MPTKHSEVCDSDDIVPFAEEFDVEQPEVHEGIFWCRDCEEEIATVREGDKEVFVL